MLKRTLAVALMAAALAGCGGGSRSTTRLFTLRPGVNWVYQVNGSVILPAALGGGSQNVASGSTLTVSAPAGTVKDANGQDVNILDRKFDLKLLDGRSVKANLRLYWSQTSQGIFVHGYNFYSGETINQAQDQFVPANAIPPLKFLYLPDPATPGLNLKYVKPFARSASRDTPPTTSYSLTFGTTSSQVDVPAGRFNAMPVIIQEAFSNVTSGDLSLTNAGFVADKGLLSGILDAHLPDGTQVKGVILLATYRF